MINFSFGIDNPFWDTSIDYQQINYVEIDKKIPWIKNKSFSLQLSTSMQSEIFSFTFRFNWRAEDHAGLFLDLHVWSYFLILNVYDDRHWDYEKNCWYDYDLEGW